MVAAFGLVSDVILQRQDILFHHGVSMSLRLATAMKMAARTDPGTQP